MKTSFPSKRDQKHTLNYARNKNFHEEFRIDFSKYGKIYIYFLLCISERTMNNNKLKSISTSTMHQPCINHWALLHIVLIKSAIHHHGQNQNELIGSLDN